jgi:methionyl-tRNA synthetase
MTETNQPTDATEQHFASIDDFMKIELRVGQIEGAERIPKSKKLIKLAVSLGETFGTRQILAGIALFYEPEALIGRSVVVVNLKPATLMGLESRGMLLAGSSDDDSVLAIIEPDASLPLGARVR